jgi:hypothetical protein
MSVYPQLFYSYNNAELLLPVIILCGLGFAIDMVRLKGEEASSLNLFFSFAFVVSVFTAGFFFSGGGRGVLGVCIIAALFLLSGFMFGIFSREKKSPVYYKATGACVIILFNAMWLETYGRQWGLSARLYSLVPLAVFLMFAFLYAVWVRSKRFSMSLE